MTDTYVLMTMRTTVRLDPSLLAEAKLGVGDAQPAVEGDEEADEHPGPPAPQVLRRGELGADDGELLQRRVQSDSISASGDDCVCLRSLRHLC